MTTSQRSRTRRRWHEHRQRPRVTMCHWVLLVVVSACSSPERDASSRESLSSIPALPLETDSARQSALANDQQTAPHLRATPSGDSLRLEVVVEPGAQLNALLPPVIELDGGRRIAFQAMGVTADSAYLTGPATAMVARAGLPAEGVLRTSYCRASELLCRTGRRVVRLGSMAQQ